MYPSVAILATELHAVSALAASASNTATVVSAVMVLPRQGQSPRQAGAKSARMAEALGKWRCLPGRNFRHGEITGNDTSLTAHYPEALCRTMLQKQNATIGAQAHLIEEMQAMRKMAREQAGNLRRCRRCNGICLPPYWENCSVCGYGPGHTMCIRRHQREEHGMFPPRQIQKEIFKDGLKRPRISSRRFSR